MTPLEAILRQEGAREERPRRHAALLAGLVGLASVALLGLSGWFITAAAAAGAAGTALAFNYMLPSAVIRLLAVVRTGARYGEAVTGHAAALRTGARLRPALFDAVANAPARRALAADVGESTARLVDDVAAIETALVRRSASGGAGAALAGGVVLTAVAGIAAILATVAVAAATWWATRVIARCGTGRITARDAALAELRAQTAELLRAGPELRCYASGRADAPIERAGAALATAQRRVDAVGAWHAGAQASGMTVAAAIVLICARAEPASIAALATLAAAMTVDAIGPWLRRVAEESAATAASARIDAVLAGREDGDAVPLRLAEPPSVELLGTEFTPGSRVLLDGRSGAGKTTLLEQLVALRPAPAGRARLDGVDLAFLTPELLRETFAWLPQDAAAIAGTVRDNLLLARPHACDTALWQALADAGLGEVVGAMPEGLDAWLGDDGARLSGGERRRLALARVYLSDAPWLLLDEPIEGLDDGTAVLVLARLEQRLRRTGQGMIVTSHRPLSFALIDARLSVENDRTRIVTQAV